MLSLATSDFYMKANMVFDSFYSKVEETFQIIWVQMKSNISSIYMYLQMHWHFRGKVYNSISGKKRRVVSTKIR